MLAGFPGRYYPSAYLIGIAFYLAYAGYKFFDENGVLDWVTKHHAENIAGEMKATQPWIEESRSFWPGDPDCCPPDRLFYGRRKSRV